MRITVFGATGRPGRYILAEGLCRDHQLTADGADAVISTVSAERRRGPNHVAEVSR